VAFLPEAFSLTAFWSAFATGAVVPLLEAVFTAGWVEPSVSVLPRCRTGRLGSVSLAVGELALGASSGGAGFVLGAGGAEPVSEGDGALVSGGEAGGVAGGGEVGGPDFAAPGLRNVGGPSSGSRIGLVLVSFRLAGTEPAGCHFPSANQLVPARTAPPTVNRPCETPLLSPSYTVSFQSAKGTGEALYALAS